MQKNKIIEDLPVQISFQVYALSKVYMLNFMRDILGKHLKHDHWEIFASDTDSVCMALAKTNIDESIPT